MKLDFSNPTLQAQLAAIGINNFQDFLNESESAILASIAQVAVTRPEDIVYPHPKGDHLLFLGNELRFVKLMKKLLSNTKNVEA